MPTKKHSFRAAQLNSTDNTPNDNWRRNIPKYDPDKAKIENDLFKTKLIDRINVSALAKSFDLSGYDFESMEILDLALLEGVILR